jgi:polyisoprenoid-binding protein YceI
MMDNQVSSHFPGFIPGIWTTDRDWSSVSFELHHRYARPNEVYFQRFAGTISIDDDPARSTVLLRLEAASLTTGNSERNRYLRWVAFLDVATFPSIIIRSTGMRRTGGRVVLDSSLTIRNVTHPVILHLEQEDSSSLQSADGDRVGITATTTIQCRAFGLPRTHSRDGET